MLKKKRVSNMDDLSYDYEKLQKIIKWAMDDIRDDIQDEKEFDEYAKQKFEEFRKIYYDKCDLAMLYETAANVIIEAREKWINKK